jgi:hypothetical protein
MGDPRDRRSSVRTPATRAIAENKAQAAKRFVSVLRATDTAAVTLGTLAGGSPHFWMVRLAGIEPAAFRSGAERSVR